MGQLLELEKWSPDWAVARLNRETGLAFSTMPTSLLTPRADQSDEPLQERSQPEAELSRLRVG